MFSRTLFASSVFLMAALSGGAQAQSDEILQRNLDKYLAYAGPPVDSFQFFKLDQWERVGRYQVVVWTRVSEAYLLTVDPPCRELEWAKAIGVTSSANTVNRRFDSVLASGERCRIEEIRPIDYKRLRKDEMAGARGG
ncbi:DUF6491 family protein [Dokdonella koreensis]|uniref:Uncharacterized protein n=1 Tax=Dokdonella koreensis DS-123 TaxID=1300342 RepID=A0A160DUF8_9GAMM|nr:DUF6491 family protein [Dokdonella koreensis]ANB18107.1 Hypothetical protein I596_2088 [Dokdonella koreensis DS-123]